MSEYMIHNLSLDEKVGQLLVFGFEVGTINDHAINLIRKYKAGNVILFARNVDSPQQLFALTHDLQQLALKEIGIPLFITIDQEGGMVTRIKNGATFFPGAMTIAATGSKYNAYKCGQHMGKELKALGINMNLAPSLDINNNPYNPVIGVRSFGDNPQNVSAYSNAFIEGLQEHIIATGKHFPGHGNTKVDSHHALPTIDASIEELKQTELVPFKEAIHNGLHAIMSSHINFPAITEEGRPCTLSSNCLTGLLRETLHFEGLIITDCMQMKAIQNKYTTPEGALMAVQAGANLICVSHSEELQIAAIKRIKEAVVSGELAVETLDQRVQRVLEYKQKHIVFNPNRTFDSVRHVVTDKSTKSFVQQVVFDAVTLLKGRLFKAVGKTLVIASDPAGTTIADEDDGTYSIIHAIENNFPTIDTLQCSVELNDNEIERITKQASPYETVVFCSYNANVYQRQIQLIQRIKAPNFHVFMMRNPYDLHFTDVSNVTAFYEYTPNSIKALIAYMKGTLEPSGKAPITVE
jgi:beta-N-acetylhexosaminidase